MNKILIMPMVFFSVMIGADNHNKSDKNAKERMQNHPNILLSYKECKETKDGISDLLSAADSVWKEIEKYPENEKKWAEAAALADLAANYSTIYDVWCKDMINKRIKMRMKADKKVKKEKDS
jgi:hypothetical protein